MTADATGEIEDVAGSGDYQRIYVPVNLATDSQWPFAPGDGVRLQIVETTCNRTVVALTSDMLEVDADETELEVAATDAYEQVDLEMVFPDGGGASE
jgi:hypothetical protein